MKEKLSFTLWFTALKRLASMYGYHKQDSDKFNPEGFKNDYQQDKTPRRVLGEMSLYTKTFIGR